MVCMEKRIMASTPSSPQPRPHHGYKSWTTSWYDRAGRRRTKRFGKVDEVSRKMAMARYSNWMNQQNKPRESIRTVSGDDTWTVARIAALYWEECKTIYQKNGKQTSTVDNIKLALQKLIDTHGDMDASDFDAPRLTELGHMMCHSVDRYGKPCRLGLSTVNARIQTIRRMYKWARTKGWVTREAAADVVMTPLLRRGRCEANAPEDVMPVAVEILNATIAAAPKTVADMIRVQVLTGMRPGELCSMRVVDIDRTAAVWIYIPRSHKNEHHGKDRVIAIGPKAQAILQPYIERRNIGDAVFWAADAHRERLEMSGSPAWQAYQTARSRFKPSRAFQSATYANRIYQACDRAFDPTMEKRKAKNFDHRWNPHRLRHNAATIAREEMGAEAAQDLLGHSQISTTMIYAERSLLRLKEIALKVG